MSVKVPPWIWTPYYKKAAVYTPVVAFGERYFTPPELHGTAASQNTHTMADLTKPDPSKYKNTPEDQARLAQDIQAFEAQELAKANAKGQLAPQSTLVGTVTAVSGKIEKGGKTFRLITLSSVDQPIMAGESIFQNNADLLRVGKKVSIVAEKRTAGVTGYVDARDGDRWKPHTGSGYSFRSVSLQEDQAAMEANAADKAEQRNALFSTVVDTAATKLQQLDGADKTAMATVLGGWNVSLAI